MALKIRSKAGMPLSGEEIIDRYFNCIGNKDLDGILDLFDDDAIVYEPFSKMQGLHGSTQIEPFLKVAMMANDNLRRAIRIEKVTSPDKITALVLFEKGAKITGRFTFEFTDPSISAGERRIKSLRIEFP